MTKDKMGSGMMKGGGSHCKFKASKGAAKDKCMSTTKPKFVPGPAPKAQ